MAIFSCLLFLFPQSTLFLLKCKLQWLMCLFRPCNLRGLEQTQAYRNTCLLSGYYPKVNQTIKSCITEEFSLLWIPLTGGNGYRSPVPDALLTCSHPAYSLYYVHVIFLKDKCDCLNFTRVHEFTISWTTNSKTIKTTLSTKISPTPLDTTHNSIILELGVSQHRMLLQT